MSHNFKIYLSQRKFNKNVQLSNFHERILLIERIMIKNSVGLYIYKHTALFWPCVCIREFLNLIWDSHLKIGHDSVRSLQTRYDQYEEETLRDMDYTLR